jgi:hypothetical protein
MGSIREWSHRADIGGLIGADQLRAWRMVSGAVVRFLFASHDVASIPQSLLFIPAAVMLSRRGRDLLSALGKAGPPIC